MWTTIYDFHNNLNQLYKLPGSFMLVYIYYFSCKSYRPCNTFYYSWKVHGSPSVKPIVLEPLIQAISTEAGKLG